MISEGTPGERLALFDAKTDIYTLLIFPLAIGALVAASTHWLRYLFGLIERKPRELVENLQLEADHKKTIKQTQLEQSRSDLFAVKEKELIERAKRDEEVADIEDSETKEKLISQLNKIRNEREQLSEELQKKSESYDFLSKEAREILMAASKDKNGSILKPNTIGERAIRVNKNTFGSKDQRTFVRYEAGLEQLINEQLVKELGLKGEVFELTHKGWEAVNAL